MKLKEIKDKSKNLDFFASFMEISKIRILQLLNQEIKTLNNIQEIKTINLNLLNAIEERWFSKKGINYFDKENSKTKKSNSSSDDVHIYFLIDPKIINVYTKNMLLKMEEILAKKVTKNDFVVTFGVHVNLICQKLELNVIEHLDYSYSENQNEFSDKISSLIEIGVKNNLFSKAIMMVVQNSNSKSDPIMQKQLLPFEDIITKQIKAYSDSVEDKSSQKIDDRTTIDDYKTIASNLNIAQTHWNPDIYVFYDHFTKTIIKQSIYELHVASKIEQYTLELQLLEEKKNRLEEEQDVFRMLYNRVRKEESTMQSLLLYAAFKLRADEEEFPLVKIKGVES